MRLYVRDTTSSSAGEEGPNYGLDHTNSAMPRIVQRLIFVIVGVALYNVLELSFLIPLRFKRWRGLYFWSLCLSTSGILPYTLCLVFIFFNSNVTGALRYVLIGLGSLGWHLMVTGQSCVLYSRLHLVCHDMRIIRGVLCMIIGNWFVSNVPTTVFALGSASAHATSWAGIYGIWERLQLCLYFVQELLISLVYSVEVVRMLAPTSYQRPASGHSQQTHRSTTILRRQIVHSSNKKVLRHLLMINILLVALDVSLLLVEFLGHYEVQVMYKAAVYSIKLKVEFDILNQLTDIAQTHMHACQNEFSGSGMDTNDLPNPYTSANLGPVVDQSSSLKDPELSVIAIKTPSA